jgi:hypothetical protein
VTAPATGLGLAVGDIARMILDGVVAHYDAVDAACTPNSRANLPTRRIIAPGNPRLIAWDCVAAGTIVNTIRGPVPIETVQVGDEVWSWDNGHMRPRAVLATIPKGERSTLRIRTRQRTLDVTPDHRMLVVRCLGRTRPGGSNAWETAWIAARDLAPGDYLVAANTVPDSEPARFLTDGTCLDEDVAWLLGLIIADGTVTSSGLHLCVFGDLAFEAADLFERIWGARSSHDSKHGLVVSSRALARTLTDLGLHRRSVERSAPAVVLGSPHKVVRAFLRGYAAGDAHLMASNAGISYATANGPLARQIRALHMMLGDRVSNIHMQQRTGTITIRGVDVVNARPLHRFRAHPNSTRDYRVVLDYRGARQALPDAHFTVDRIAAINDGPTAAVYDLTVEGAHSFIADGLVAHNCEQVVVTMSGIGVGPAPGEGGRPAGRGNPISATGLRHAVFAVQVVRCTPESRDGTTPPPEQEVTDAGLAYLRDAGLLSQALVDVCTRVAGGLPIGSRVVPGAVEALGPEGGFAAVEGALAVTAGLLA